MSDTFTKERDRDWSQSRGGTTLAHGRGEVKWLFASLRPVSCDIARVLLDGTTVVGAAWLPVDKRMDTSTHPTVRRVLDRARRDPDVLAVILFGSHARGEASAASDVDLCLVLAVDTTKNLAMSRTRLAYLAEGAGDLVIFQQLPLHLRSRVLKEGRVLFVRDEDALYDVAIRAARAFEGFRHLHRAYLDEIARG